MIDPREITIIDNEIELAPNEYLYCLVRGGKVEDEDGRQLLIATNVFRSKDGKTWEKWEEAEGLNQQTPNQKAIVCPECASGMITERISDSNPDTSYYTCRKCRHTWNHSSEQEAEG